MIEVARIHKVDNGSAVKAFADVIFQGKVLVKGIRVVSNKGGNLFAAMPTQQGKDSNWHETVSLLDDELKQELQEVVLKAYKG